VRPAVLVMAKAPVSGQAKTRLGARVGDAMAAGLAAASILDTLDVCEAVFPDSMRRHVALAGDLDDGASSEDLHERLSRWTVHPQRGDGFADRLAHAHEDVGRATGGSVVQIGMDTPHLTAENLTDVADRVGNGNDAVLGPAEDGGWWVLAVTDHRLAECLRGVEMSTARTYVDTLAALQRAGARVADATTMRDVDTASDAAQAAASAPGTRFARLWSTTPDGA
jgi:glycosyltransferase A (GT-A) superfamily protein (DUF2064 family)